MDLQKAEKINKKMDITSNHGKRSLISFDESQKISLALYEKFKNENRDIIRKKVTTCLFFIDSARRFSKKDNWQIKMLLRGKFPDFVLRKSLTSDKMEYFLNFNSVKKGIY